MVRAHSGPPPRRVKLRLLRFRLQPLAFAENCARYVASPLKITNASLVCDFVGRFVLGLVRASALLMQYEVRVRSPRSHPSEAQWK